MAAALLLLVAILACSAPGVAQSQITAAKGEPAERGMAYFGWLLECRDAAHESTGVMVAAVTPGSPAAMAGVRAGDLVVSVASLGVDAYAPGALSDVHALLASLHTGTRVLVSFRREKHEHTVAMQVKAATVVLGEIAGSAGSITSKISLLDDVMDKTAGLEDLGLFAIVCDESAPTELRKRALEHVAGTSNIKALARLREVEVPEELREPWGKAVFTAERRLEQRRAVKEIERALRWIRERYVDRDDVGVRELTDAAIQGMLESLDPYSDYLTEREMRETRNSRYEGIGITLESWEDRHYVHWVFPEGPGRDRLQPGDEILTVDGEPAAGHPRADVVSNIRGKIHQQVQLTIRRRGVDEPIDVEIVRGSIQKPVVTYRDLPGGIGYMRLHTFARDAHREVRSALNALSAAGARSLVLDLRGNRGGSVDEVQRIGSIFLPRDTLIAYSQGRERFFDRRDLEARQVASPWVAPMVVLVDSGSASAAEMLSGALQVAGRARLVGEPTYGKGVGQSTFQIDGVAGPRYLKLTTFRYYFANDKSIHGVGVEPDLLVEPESVAAEVREELLRLRATGEMYRYITEHLRGDHALLTQATFFGPSTPTDREDRYPGFGEWFDSLETSLGEDAALEGLRQFLRLHAEHELIHGHFVCDLERDRQLHAAIEEVAGQAELDLGTEPTYAHFIASAPTESTPPSDPGRVPAGAASGER